MGTRVGEIRYLYKMW